MGSPIPSKCGSCRPRPDDRWTHPGIATICIDDDPRDVRPRAQGAAPRPSRRRPAAGDDHRPRRRVRLRRPADDRRRRPRGVVPARRRPQVARALPRDVRAHRRASCRSATRSSGSPPSAPRTSRPTASCTPRCATRPELSTEQRPDARRGRRGDPRGLPAREAAGRRGRSPDRDEAARDRDAPGRPVGRGRRVRGPLARRGGRRLRHRRAGGRLPRRPATSMRSTSSAARTSTSRSTPASRSGCRPSGRRSSSAAPSASGTACGSSTTSRSATTASVELGRLAAFVRDRRVPLEMCPTSNVHTGAAASIADAPASTCSAGSASASRVNTDNRLMSGVSLSSEFAALDAAFGIGLGEMEWLTINALKTRVRAVRRAAAAHQRGRQARLRAPARRGVPGRRRPGDGSRRDRRRA